METTPITPSLREKFAHIPGWAHDADPEDLPNYPYKHHTGDDHRRLEWERPPLQEKTVELLQSTEHLRTPAVFGTMSPPSGLSGTLRRRAFNYSESMLRHWLLLMLADRVEALEGLLADLGSGHVPALEAERGMPAIRDHDKPAYIRRKAVGTAVVFAVIGVVAYRLLSRKEPEAGSREAVSLDHYPETE